MLKAQIHAQSGQIEESRATIRTLTSLNIADIDFVYEVHALEAQCSAELGVYGPSASDDVTKLWNAAINSTRASDKSAASIAMFQTSMQFEHWDQSQQALTKLKSQNPLNRNYYLSQLATLALLAAELKTVKSAKAPLFENLTFKSLETAIRKTVSDPESPQAIKSTQELRPITQIYLKFDRTEELLEILSRSERLKVGASIAGDDADLQKLLLRLQCSEGRFEEVMHQSIEALQNGQASSFERLCDWDTWSYIQRAHKAVADRR